MAEEVKKGWLDRQINSLMNCPTCGRVTMTGEVLSTAVVTREELADFLVVLLTGNACDPYSTRFWLKQADAIIAQFKGRVIGE